MNNENSQGRKGYSSDRLTVRPMTVIDQRRAIVRTTQLMDRVAAGEVPFLRTEWDNLNAALMGGYEIPSVNGIFGASGHGKSYFLNFLSKAIASKDLNPRIDPILLRFSFEMRLEAELLRDVSGRLKIPYADLIGARHDPHSETAPISPELLRKVKLELKDMLSYPFEWVETSGNRYEMQLTIEDFRRKYPDKDLFISLDHTLLAEGTGGENEVQMVASIAKMFIDMKKRLNATSFMLGQLNDKIEQPDRRNPDNLSFHYPIKTDIHGSKQILHAVDTALVIHRPELLHITEYGPDRVDTRDLLALHIIKNRIGEQSVAFLKQNLANGRFEKFERDFTVGDTMGYGLG